MFRKLLRSETIRRRVVWILLLILLPPFAFFMVGDQMLPDRWAGEIFGRRIPVEEFQQEYQVVRANMLQQLGQDLGEAAAVFEPFFQQQTWDRLILREQARRSVTVQDDEVATFLHEQPGFQRDGKFSPEFYYAYLNQLGVSPRFFEDRVRDDLRIKKLIDERKHAIQITDDEVREAYAKEHEKRRVALVTVLKKDLEARIRHTLTEADIRAYYESHPQLVRIPAKRTIDYIGVSAEQIIATLPTPSDDQVQAYYDDHRDAEFRSADGTVTPFKDAADTIRKKLLDEAAAKQLRTVAMDLQDDLDDELRFVEIALTRGLNVKRIGPVEAGTEDLPDGLTGFMVREAFAVPISGTTEVFDTPLGVYLLQPVSEIPEIVPPLEQVRTEIETAAVSDRAAEAAQARAQQIHDELHALVAQGVAFERACEILQVTPVRPEPFTRTGSIEEFGGGPMAAAQLFDVAVGELSGVLEGSKGSAVAKVEGVVPFDQGQFEQQKEEFRTKALGEKQDRQLSEWVGALRQQARLKDFLNNTPR